jgi:hypothetical protein
MTDWRSSAIIMLTVNTELPSWSRCRRGSRPVVTGPVVVGDKFRLRAQLSVAGKFGDGLFGAVVVD